MYFIILKAHADVSLTEVRLGVTAGGQAFLLKRQSALRKSASERDGLLIFFGSFQLRKGKARGHKIF